MRKWLAATLAVGALQAAVVRGVVVEHQSGRPLARALVVLQPVAGTAGTVQSARTDAYGAFAFQSLPGGAYLVSASRRSFAPMQYGQKRWKASGVPVVLEEAVSTALSIRLQRFGSVAGTVVDENDVGLPEHDVAVYRNSRPPQLISKSKTDDRGMYRIGGLEPGSYLVRTLSKHYEDGGYLPTFGRDTGRIEEARPVDALLDQQTDNVIVRPIPGQLFIVAGIVSYSRSGVTVTLTSDMGSETTLSAADGSFKFNPTAPGAYEISAQISSGTRLQVGWLPILVDRNRTDYRVPLGAMSELQVAVEDTHGQAIDPQSVAILARRKDLSGDGKPGTLRLSQGRVLLAPGRWDLALMSGTSYYVASFSGHRERADGWNEIVLQGPGPAPVKFVLSGNPGAVHGTVAGAAGAPVFLEAYDPESRRRLQDLRMTRTDLKGRYQFYGLAPGTYRLASTFEFDLPDAAAMNSIAPKTVKVEEGRDLLSDLDLFVIR